MLDDGKGHPIELQWVCVRHKFRFNEALNDNLLTDRNYPSLKLLLNSLLPGTQPFEERAVC